MVKRIADPGFVANIKFGQTGKLFAKSKEKFGAEEATIRASQKVILITPGSISEFVYVRDPRYVRRTSAAVKSRDAAALASLLAAYAEECLACDARPERELFRDQSRSSDIFWRCF